MKIVKAAAALSLGSSMVLAAGAAEAHIKIISGPASAGTTQVVTFSVGHGCSKVDTSTVTIDIPASILSLRAENSDLGKATVTTDATGVISHVTWSKPDADLQPTDSLYYALRLSIAVPAQPFTVINFPAHQTCKTPAGVVSPVVDWIGTTADQADAGVEPAPALYVLPARQAGWNKFTVAQPVADLSAFFGDAAIVWKDSAAYSANAATLDQIGGTTGVTKLTTLATGDVVWVKY